MFKLDESGTVVVIVVVVVAVVVGCGSRRSRYGLTLSPSHFKSSLSLFPTG